MGHDDKTQQPGCKELNVRTVRWWVEKVLVPVILVPIALAVVPLMVQYMVR